MSLSSLPPAMPLNGHDVLAGLGRDWKWRAIRATHGNQSRLGCILIAVIGRMPLNPPRIRGNAVILEDGTVLADVELRNGKGFLATNLGSIEELVGNFRGLADHLKLSDKDRVEMFNELRMWCAKDFRAIKEPLE